MKSEFAVLAVEGQGGGTKRGQIRRRKARHPHAFARVPVLWT
jgi:hypothetical protein